MVNVTSQILASESGPWAQVRTGTISSANDNSATIIVGGTSFLASFISPYEPQPGHLVAAIRQDASWIIIGRIAGAGENLLSEGSFEGSISGGPPVGWTEYDISGTSTGVVATSPLAIDGDKILTVFSNTGAAAESYVYSSPIPVATGEQYSISVYAASNTTPGSAPVAADAELYALWFANATDLYPTTSAADSLVAGVTMIAEAPPFTPLSGTVTVPGATSILRVGLRSTVSDQTGVLWDFSIVRLVA